MKDAPIAHTAWEIPRIWEAAIQALWTKTKYVGEIYFDYLNDQIHISCKPQCRRGVRTVLYRRCDLSLAVKDAPYLIFYRWKWQWWESWGAGRCRVHSDPLSTSIILHKDVGVGPTERHAGCEDLWKQLSSWNFILILMIFREMHPSGSGLAQWLRTGALTLGQNWIQSMNVYRAPACQGLS